MYSFASFNEVTTTNDKNITYVDFVPSCTKKSGIVSKSKFQPFSELMNKANKWLNEHPNFAVKGCETIGSSVSSEQAVGECTDTQKTNYHIKITTRTHSQGNTTTHTYIFNIWILKCLRLHIQPKGSDESPEPHQIGSLHIIPDLISESGILSKAKYSAYSDTLKKANEYVNRNPIPGKILNIEAVAIKRKNNKIKDDGSLLFESTEDNGNLTTMFRIFYLIGRPLYEKIALKPNISERIDYIVPRHTIRDYFNIMRVFYVTGPDIRIDYSIGISCKAFQPALLMWKSSVKNTFETFKEFYVREIVPFISYNSHAQIINFEIVAKPMNEDQELMSPKRVPPKILTAEVRVYFIGPVSDPPPGYIQPKPVPVIKKQSCSIL
ncbi:DgyrCDS9053 [Dimorphilus gyrociliatus]|uniref:DgyrCDS9053 n=1 Tax=Dimorphilus gyrociliatus TaxID=2664684 RepID=A0A7I8VXP4_9ANNE|nr:DgyrCDS9053 [Dimorphilus gyrociliatus]